MVGVQVIVTFGAHDYQMWPLLSNGLEFFFICLHLDGSLDVGKAR